MIYIIDFGLANRYMDSSSHAHIPFKSQGVMNGTASYASLYAHLGYESSRRDDLESVGYVLIYLLKGQLPWQAGKKEYSLERIKNDKTTNKIQKLCAGLPPQFEKYLLYCRNLKFEETPSYGSLKCLFEECMGDGLGCEMDWQLIKVDV